MLKKSLLASVAALCAFLTGCATTTTPPSRIVDIDSLSGSDIQAVALGLIHGQPPESLKNKASIATFFTPDGIKKVDMLARLGKSPDSIAAEYAGIYDAQFKDRVDSWYGVGFTYKSVVSYTNEASIGKLYSGNKINININVNVTPLETSKYFKSRLIEPYFYTEAEATAARFRIVDRSDLPMERVLDSKYSGVQGVTENGSIANWGLWQIAVSDRIPVRCSAEYPINRVQDVIQQGARSLRVDVYQSSTIVPYLRKRRSGEGPMLAFKVIDSMCQINNISSNR